MNNYFTNKTAGSGSNTRYWIFAIIVLTLIVYLPSFNNEFINYDDQRLITENPLIKEFSAQNIKIWFTEFVDDVYQPLTMLSWGIDHATGGLNPFMFHFTNLLLHLLNTFLVFRFIYLLVRRTDMAVIIATLFGVHTFHVESVVWMSERKDLLYAFFFLASLVVYLRYINNNKTKYLIFSLLLFLLSLLSKGQGVTLAVTLIIIDWFKGRGLLSKKVILEKIPFFVIALVFGIIAILGHKASGTLEEEAVVYEFHERFAFACYGFTQYIIKSIIPYELSAFYPYPVKTGNDIPSLYWLYLIPVIIIFLLTLFSLKRYKYIAFGLMFFIINIVLVLKLFQVQIGYFIMTDRYSYISSIGIFFIIASFFMYLSDRKVRYKLPAAIILITYITSLWVFTFSRTQEWKDSITVWSDVISKYPDLRWAWNKRGLAKKEQGDYQGAIADYNRAIEIKPYSPAYTNRGVAKGMLGDFRGAVADFDKAINIKPYDHDAYNNRAVAKGNLGDLEGAIEDLGMAIHLKPDFASAYFTRAQAYIRLKDTEKACNDLHKAYELGYKQAEVEMRRYCR